MQTVVPLRRNGAMRLTTARYYTPSWGSIQAKGIKPDIAIEEEPPKDLKDKAAAIATVSEASLPKRLKNPDDALTQSRERPQRGLGFLRLRAEYREGHAVAVRALVPTGNCEGGSNGR